MAESVRAVPPPFLRFSPTLGWPGTAPARAGVPDEEGPLRLAPDNRQAIAPGEPFGSFGGRTLPRGVAVSPEGRLLIADPKGRVVLHAAAADLVEGAAPFVPLFAPRPDPSDAYHLTEPTDVGFTPRGDLFIADPVGQKVLVMDWPSATLRAELRISGWQPVAVVSLPCGSLLVADEALRTVHRFDALFRIVPDWLSDDVELASPRALAVTAGASSPRDPIVLVLDNSQVKGLDATGREAAHTRGVLTPPALERRGRGFTFADPRWPGRAPLRIEHLDVTRDGRLAGTSLPVVALPRRIRIPLSGKLIFDALDSDQRGFAWDRVTLDLALPDTARLLLRTLTSDAPIAADQIGLQPDHAWSRPLQIGASDLPEVLVQSPPGRFLWIWLDLFSDGVTSPTIHRIDVHGPRRSGLTHLPPPFHSDPQSRDFLDRFLSYFDTLFAELRQQSSDMAQYFDPMAIPDSDWLAWLGSWFDLSFLSEWDEQTRREIVAHAVQSARERGTRTGLGRMLRWHLGLAEPWPGLIEHHRLSSNPPPVGQTAMPPGPTPHRLTIVLPRASVTPDQEARLMRLIDGWLPAHVGYDLRYVQPGIVVGQQSTPGLDTYVGTMHPTPLGSGRAGLDLAAAYAPRGVMLSNPTSLQSNSGDCHGR